MKHKPFFDLAHAERYLCNSIITVEGHPVLVVSIHQTRGGSRLDMSYISTIYSHLINEPNKVKRIALNNPKVDMNPLPLGFANVGGGLDPELVAIKTFRAPVRAWKVGLTYGSFRTIPSVYRDRGLLYSQSLFDTMSGKYPSFEETRDRRAETSSRAFSRRFSIDLDGAIYYLHVEGAVGYLYKGTVELKREYLYLSEQLEKDMVR